MNDAEREQIKLRAAALDRISTACTTIGVLAPVAGTFLGGSTVPVDGNLMPAALVYIGVAVILHYAALFVLEGLDE